MKTCKKCGCVKELSQYYKHAQMADGHLNKCMDCVKERVRLHSKTDRGRENERRRNQKPGRKRMMVIYSRRKRKRHPEKYRANNAVARALHTGKIRRFPCIVCGEERVQAHHEDYSKPLDVIWLCEKHHKDLHADIYNRKTGTDL